MKPKASRRKEIMIRMEINYMKTKRKQKQNNRTDQ